MTERTRTALRWTAALGITCAATLLTLATTNSFALSQVVGCPVGLACGWWAANQ